MPTPLSSPGSSEERTVRVASARGTLQFRRRSGGSAEIDYAVTEKGRTVSWEPGAPRLAEGVAAVRDAELNSVTGQLMALQRALASVLHDDGDAVQLDSRDQWEEERSWEDRGSAITIDGARHAGHHAIAQDGSDAALAIAALDNLVRVKRASIVGIYADTYRDMVRERLRAGRTDLVEPSGVLPTAPAGPVDGAASRSQR